eukprot:1158804-Pelagomonas_calceolata.AAC.1
MRLPASPPGPNPKVPPATQTPCLSPSPLFRQGGKPVGETHCVPRPTGCLFACGPVRAALALLRECVWGGMGAGGTHVQTRQGTGDCSSARGSARDASPMLPHTRRAPSSEVEASRGGGSTPVLLSICAHNQPCNWQASQHERGHATSHAIGKHHSRSMAIQPAMPLACITAGDQPCNRQAAQQHSFKERAAALDKP